MASPQRHSPLRGSSQQYPGEAGQSFGQELRTSLPAACGKLSLGLGISDTPCSRWPFPDPRPSGIGHVCTVAFYFPDYETAWDKQCHASFLGNFYNMESRLSFQGRGYRNAEAAFQSLKYPSDADIFADFTGTEAFNYSKRLRQVPGLNADLTYSGFETNWKAMLSILKVKFDPRKHGDLKDKLELTGDAFLLEHNDKTGKDNIWSDNEDGTGKNWLGLQLMLVRAWNRPGQRDSWSQAIERIIDPESGRHNFYDDWWQSAVRSATLALKSDTNMRSNGQGYRSTSYSGGTYSSGQRSPQSYAGGQEAYQSAAPSRLTDSRMWPCTRRP